MISEQLKNHGEEVGYISSVGEFAFGFGDGAVEGDCGFDPLGDD